MLLMLCFVELLPHTFHHAHATSALILLLGCLLVILLERHLAPRLTFGMNSHYCSHTDSHISQQVACTSVGCIIICAFFDGVAIYSGFQLGSATGWQMGLGLLLHVAPEGAMASSLAIAGGLSDKAARLCSLYVGLAVVLGALLAGGINRIASFQEFGLPLSTGVLLYVTFTHLLPSVLSQKRGPGDTFSRRCLYLYCQPTARSHFNRKRALEHVFHIAMIAATVTMSSPVSTFHTPTLSIMRSLHLVETFSLVGELKSLESLTFSQIVFPAWSDAASSIRHESASVHRLMHYSEKPFQAVLSVPFSYFEELPSPSSRSYGLTASFSAVLRLD